MAPHRRSYLDWPFFDDAHRALADELDAWARSASSRARARRRCDADCRRWSATLGARLAALLRAGRLRRRAEPLDVRSLCLVRETLAYHDGLADFAFAMQGLGSGAIALVGSGRAEARATCRAVAAARRSPAFALSEPEAGSDVAAMRDDARAATATRYVLDGDKTWISNGGIADFYVVFARTGEAPGARGISRFVVDADTPGLRDRRAHRRDRAASAGDGSRSRAAACRRSPARRARARASSSRWRRSTSSARRSAPRRSASRAARSTRRSRRATAREMFGATLADFQLAQAKLAEMALDDRRARAARLPRGLDEATTRAAASRREAAMAKMHATEAAQRVIDDAVQMLRRPGRDAAGIRSSASTARSARCASTRARREVQQLIIARQALAAYATEEAAP